MQNATSDFHFVLLHGAWHGAWCWERVALNLKALGHNVTTPTQRGVGERADELTLDITLDDFVEDVVEHLIETEHNDVILVGHSFGGCGITGAADRVPERIAKLVYLDALILESGQTPFSQLPENVVAERKQLAAEQSGGLSLPPPSPDSFGVTDPADAAWLSEFLTPHPLGSFTSPLTLNAPVGNGIEAIYIACNDPIYAPLEATRDWVQRAGWPMIKLGTGHDAMVSAPALTTEYLLRIAAGDYQTLLN